MDSLRRPRGDLQLNQEVVTNGKMSEDGCREEVPTPHLPKARAAREEILEKGGRYAMVRDKKRFFKGGTSVICGREWIRQLLHSHRWTPLVAHRVQTESTKIPPL